MTPIIYTCEDLEADNCKVEESSLTYPAVPMKKNFDEVAKECNAITVDTFFDELNVRIKRRFNASCLKERGFLPTRFLMMA